MLALKAETAISKLQITEQEPIRHLVATNIPNLCKKYETAAYSNKKDQYERTINDTNKKLLDNNARVTRADKGNTLLIISNEK
jgi:hypothetical protein